jgi:hypothetical protein
MIFDTQIPIVQNYVAQPSHKFSGDDATLMKLLGYKDDGERNTWGKIASFNPSFALGSNLIANNVVKNTNDAELQAAVKLSNQKKMGEALAGLQVGAGIGLSIAGMPQAGVPMALSGVQQGVKSFGNGGEMKYGGSHASNNDFAVVHKNTGQDTGVRLENGEVIFSEDRSDMMKRAVDNGDKDFLMKIVEQQLKVNNKSNVKEIGDNELNIGNEVQLAQNNSPYGWNGMTGTFDISNPNTLTTPNINQPIESQGLVASTTTPNYASYLQYAPALAQIGIGLAGASKSLPKGFTIPEDWNNYYNQTKQQSNEGFTPEEKIMYQNDILGNYKMGVNKLVNYAGGNSAAVLGNLTELGQAKNEAELKLAAMDKQQKRANMATYADALNKDIAMKQIIDNMTLEMAMKNRGAASSLANTGLSNLDNGVQYQQKYGKGSPYYEAMLELAKRGNIQNR